MSVLAAPAPSRSGAALLPVAFATLLVVAVWLRYGGRTSDSDTATITRAARGVLDRGVVDPGGVAYTNGFSYPVLVATVTSVTGLSPEVVQTIVLPWLLVVMAVVAFVAFRAIAGTARAGAISALLLLVQPDFLFVTQRGSHEKVTWMLVLLLAYSLVSSLQQRQPGRAAPFVLIFYLCGFALICTNVFFGSSFLASILLVLLGTTLVGRVLLKDLPARRLPRRLVYALLSLGCFSFLFIFHIYPVAQHTLENLDTTVQRVSALYLSAEPLGSGGDADAEPETDPGAGPDEPPVSSVPPREGPTRVSPYATIASSWTSLRVYVVLTAFTWILIAWAVLTWFLTAARFLRRGVFQQELPLFVAWAFAAVTALQIAISILADTTGSLGSNVQLRLFPAFTLFAVPMVVTAPSIRHRVVRATTWHWLVPAGGLVALGSAAVAYPATVFAVVAAAVVLLMAMRFLPPPERLGWLPKAAVVSLFTCFTLTAILKATNDPLVSNKWTFYTAAEFRGLGWVEERLSPETPIWTEFDERLATVARGYMDNAASNPGDRRWTAGTIAESEGIRYMFVSDVTAARASRLALPLPASEREDVIYDNGRVHVIHRVPETPFQP